ncbi:hypothetical protein glysoja_030440 [Glycine soja]|uniref:Uncharacterized protein n=1 Tax=Glycine soja TaxID=3848 RepID=A0A0B2R2L7_GLYSO|nr:hypothetical protein glysoja_030440 [Glycine soja]
MAESHRTQPSRRQPSCACRVTPRSRVKRRDPVSVPSGLISPSAVAEALQQQQPRCTVLLRTTFVGSSFELVIPSCPTSLYQVFDKPLRATIQD